MSKETFKLFVRDNPSLVKYVNNNTMSWQKFYEMYELYGSDNNIWNNYLFNNEEDISVGSDRSFKELIAAIKGINLEKVQKGIDSIQKTISLVQGLGVGESVDNSYEKKPTFKHFDD